MGPIDPGGGPQSRVMEQDPEKLADFSDKTRPNECLQRDRDLIWGDFARDVGSALLLRLCLIEPELRAIDLCPGGIIQRLLLEVLPRTIDVELLGLEQLGLVHRDDVA